MTRVELNRYVIIVEIGINSTESISVLEYLEMCSIKMHERTMIPNRYMKLR